MQSTTNELEVRGSDAIEILINDHQTIKELLSQLVEGQQTARRAVLERLKMALTVHNATEENLVYPALNKVAGKKSEAMKLYNETAEADVLVFELDTMLKKGDESDFPAKAEALRAAILEHIEDEEEKAFPHLQKHAEPNEQQMLTSAVREFRSQVHVGTTGPSSTTGTV